jgi:two-component system CheB/CheR fusion protein
MSRSEPPCKVLVVEDHADTAAMASRMVRLVGFDVAVAADFRSAAAAARAARYDVLLCDIGLPDGDGYALLAEVRAMYPVRAVAVTGYG